jgi:hypothetical protein
VESKGQGQKQRVKFEAGGPRGGEEQLLNGFCFMQTPGSWGVRGRERREKRKEREDRGRRRGVAVGLPAQTSCSPS